MPQPTSSGWYWRRRHGAWKPVYVLRGVEGGPLVFAEPVRMAENGTPVDASGVDWGPRMSQPRESPCLQCGQPVIHLADQHPVCDACLDQAPPEDDRDELYVIVDLPLPTEPVREREDRVIAYQRWMSSPDLQRLPPGAQILGEAMTCELAFANATTSSVILIATRSHRILAIAMRPV